MPTFVFAALLILLLKFCKIIFMFHSVKMVAVPMARNFIKFVTQLLKKSVYHLLLPPSKITVRRRRP